MSETLRIAHLVVGMADPADCERVAQLCRALDAADVESWIVGSETRHIEAAPRGVPRRYAHINATMPGFGAALARLLVRGGFDAVHAHGPLAACALVQTHAHVPLVASIATLRGPPLQGNWWRALQVRRALRAMDEVTVNRPELAARTARLAGRPVSVVRDALPPACYARPVSPPARGEPFRFVAALDKAAGRWLADAAAAFARLRAAGIDAELHLVVDGNAARAVQRRMGEEGWLHLHDAPTDRAGLLAGMHAMVAMHRGEETPLLWEALAVGLPVIAARGSGVPAPASGAAIVADARGEEALCALLARVIRDELLWHRLSRASRAAAQAVCADRVAAAMRERYVGMLAPERPHGDVGLLMARPGMGAAPGHSIG